MERIEEKLLLFGGVPSVYLAEWEITGDLALAEAKLGVRFESIPHEELVARYQSMGEADLKEALRLANELIDGASPRRGRKMPPAPPMGEIAKATRLYVTMQSFVEDRQGDAVTIVCGPWIRGGDLPVPCVALMLFQERGIPAACQGDIDALLTMVMVKRATGQSSFMGGAIKAQGHLGVNHCVICRNLPGPDKELQPYTVSNYHGRKDSPTVWADVPTGETVTVARLTHNLEQLLLLRGRLVANQTDNTRCRNTLVVEVPDRDRVFRAVKGVQNHYVVVYGDHIDALTEMAAPRGIEIARLDL
ncbi:MAG: hypothetical protein ACP5JG_04530 [Anaerolineae bacterium]